MAGRSGYKKPIKKSDEVDKKRPTSSARTKKTELGTNVIPSCVKLFLVSFFVIFFVCMMFGLHDLGSKIKSVAGSILIGLVPVLIDKKVSGNKLAPLVFAILVIFSPCLGAALALSASDYTYTHIESKNSAQNPSDETEAAPAPTNTPAPAPTVKSAPEPTPAEPASSDFSWHSLFFEKAYRDGKKIEDLIALAATLAQSGNQSFKKYENADSDRKKLYLASTGKAVAKENEAEGDIINGGEDGEKLASVKKILKSGTISEEDKEKVKEYIKAKEEACSARQEAHKHVPTYENLALIINTHQELGDFEMKLGNYDEARVHFDACLSWLGVKLLHSGKEDKGGVIDEILVLIETTWNPLRFGHSLILKEIGVFVN